jgi:hypothetical protein
MKTKFYALAVLGAASLMTAISCFAGVESSGGSLSQVYGNAWFISGSYGKKIKTCYVVSNDFGTVPAKLEAAILQASKTWSDYFLAKNIQTPKSPAGGYGPSNPYFISSDVDLMSACDGSEDLKIYFGAKDAQVEKAIAQFIEPYAFSEPTAASSQLWGKGFIYVATPKEVSSPSWDTGNHLVGVLLHELGHVLGNGHVDSTIMDANIAQYFQYSNPTDSLNQIDQARELRTCSYCGETYTGELSLGNTYDANDALNTLMGKVVTSQTLLVDSLKFVKKSKQGSEPDNLPEGDLTYTDTNGTVYHFYLTTQSLVAESEINVPLFMTPDSSLFSYDNTLTGVLTGDNGSTFPIVVNVNADGAAFEIVLQDGQSYPQKLFISSTAPAMWY